MAAADQSACLEVMMDRVVHITRPRHCQIRTKSIRKITHGTEMTLYSIPIRVPTCPLSEIHAIQGVSTEMNAPDKNPNRPANTINSARFLTLSHNASIERPERNADGVRRLK